MEEVDREYLATKAEPTLLGLAVADALGAPLEFSSSARASAAVKAGLEMTGGGVWDPGEWTDDTAMALRLAECLAEHGIPLDYDDLARRYAEWAAEPPKDIGITTRAALTRVTDAETARRNARRLHEAGRKTAGNGTVMRVAPLAFAPLSDTEMTAAAREEARLTHWDPAAGDASAALCLAIRAAARSEDPLVAAQQEANDERNLQAIAAAASGERATAAALVAEGGTCWSTLAVALLALEAPEYEAGVTWAISLGHDTDTNAAVAGALLACRDGLEAIPESWLSGLRDRQRIERAAKALAGLNDAG